MTTKDSTFNYRTWLDKLITGTNFKSSTDPMDGQLIVDPRILDELNVLGYCDGPVCMFNSAAVQTRTRKFNSVEDMLADMKDIDIIVYTLKTHTITHATNEKTYELEEIDPVTSIVLRYVDINGVDG